MKQPNYNINTSLISNISLYKKNPRHDEKSSEKEVIEYLVSNEDVYNLAKDIVENGINPMEVFGIFPTKGNPNKFYSAEGNRRICALKLLTDPQKAPKPYIDRFKKLSDKWNPIESVYVVIFNSFEDTKIWLDRIHGDENSGVGRKKWNAEQKARFFPENKNRIAQELLDYLEKEGAISAKERAKKITTVTRFMESEKFRDVLGVAIIDDHDPKLKIADADLFKLRFTKFIGDLNNAALFDGSVVGSRFNKDKIVPYAESLLAIEKPRTSKPASKTIDLKGKNPSKKSKPVAPIEPERPKNISSNREIEKKLKNLENYKLQKLYYSICTISLESHTPLLSVGVWCFLEVLTADAGRNEGNDIVSFFDANMLAFGVSKSDKKSIRAAIVRIQDFGNTTKHRSTSANFSSVT